MIRFVVVGASLAPAGHSCSWPSASGPETLIPNVTSHGAPSFRRSPPVDEVHILWMTAGLGCDGDSVAMTAATNPSIEDLLLGTIPGLPKVHLHNPMFAYEVGDEFLEWFYRAEKGKLDPFVVVFEGAVPNEHNKDEGYWAAFGTDKRTKQPITTCEWIDRLVHHAWAVVAAGTCAAYGGIPAMEGNPTGAMGLGDYLGRGWRSRCELPVINVPGCPTKPDNIMETLLAVLFHLAGLTETIPLDDLGRPTWLFGMMAREGCTRTGFNEHADFATGFNSRKCLAKQGCWGSVVNCNVSKRGWMGGLGGCPSVGGICIGCTMPGFPDRFMPFMEPPMGGQLAAEVLPPQGHKLRKVRMIANAQVNVEPQWRKPDIT